MCKCIPVCHRKTKWINATIWKRISGWPCERTRKVACNKLMMFTRWAWIIQSNFRLNDFRWLFGGTEESTMHVFRTYSFGRLLMHGYVGVSKCGQHGENRIRPRYMKTLLVKTTNIRHSRKFPVCTQKLCEFYVIFYLQGNNQSDLWNWLCSGNSIHTNLIMLMSLALCVWVCDELKHH